MLRIRFARMGKKNKAQFRVVVAEKARAANKKFIEILGHYNPHSKEKVFKKERIQYWISKGAQPSPTVHNFLVDLGIIKDKKVTSWKPKKKAKEVEKIEAKESGKENKDENKSIDKKAEPEKEKPSEENEKDEVKETEKAESKENV